MSALQLAAAPGYEAPSTQNFWQPIIGSGAWAITRPMFLYVISVIVLAGVLMWVTRRLTVVPSKRQFAAEGFYNLVRDGLGRDIIGSHDFLRFLPLLFSLFSLILLNNVFSIIPVIQYPTMSRIGFPVALALVVFVVFHVVGLRNKGFVGYFKSLVPPNLPTGLAVPIFFLELLTYFFTRPVTLALRLFGNMFAGHILLLLFITGADYMLLTADSTLLHVISIGPFLGVFVMTAFEFIVQVLQAYIFTLLTALYIAGALAAEH
jgi:F-type H+-transporting ATPase subunit a